MVCSTDDPWVTLTYFTARSNLVTYAFLYEKVKTVDFSETIAASGLKGSRSRHLIKRYMSIEGQGHFFTLTQGRVKQTFKLDFLRNYCTDLNQILYKSFQVQGNENLMTWCWSHDKMATAPIYGKTLQKSSSPEPEGWFPGNLVCSIGDSSPS